MYMAQLPSVVLRRILLLFKLRVLFVVPFFAFVTGGMKFLTSRRTFFVKSFIYKGTFATAAS